MPKSDGTQLEAAPSPPATVPLVGHDHATLALIPLGFYGSGGTEPVSVAYQAEVDGRIRRVNVTVRPGAGLRLPTPADQLVFMALLQIATDGGNYGPVLECRLTQVFKLLDWSRSGTNYQRLMQALSRLHAMQIEVHAALFARNGSAYTDVADAVHVIERFTVTTHPTHRQLRLEWGSLVKDAFALGDVKRLNWDTVRALRSPVAVQLYRLIDRVVLAGSQTWVIGWRPLAQALGISDEHQKPANFYRGIKPHIEALVEQGVLEGCECQRGGRFTFRVHNYPRVQVRRVLIELGVYAEAARLLLAGFDEAKIMAQCDCLRFGKRPAGASGGYLVQAVRENYELRYPADELPAFLAMCGLYSADEVRCYHRAGLWLCGLSEDLFAACEDAGAWPLELRAVVRFMMCHDVDAEQVLRVAAGQ